MELHAVVEIVFLKVNIDPRVKVETVLGHVSRSNQAIGKVEVVRIIIKIINESLCIVKL